MSDERLLGKNTRSSQEVDNYGGGMSMNNLIRNIVKFCLAWMFLPFMIYFAVMLVFLDWLFDEMADKSAKRMFNGWRKWAIPWQSSMEGTCR